MNIKFNEVTWYSRIAALVLFLLVIPALTFYIGEQYERAYSVPTIATTEFIPAHSVSEGNPSSGGSPATRKQLTKAVVDGVLLAAYDIRRWSFVSPLYPDRYYFAMSDQGDESIGYYDFAADKNADLEERNLDIMGNATWLYQKKQPENPSDFSEFRIVGFDGHKLVFYETLPEDTPGPCSNPWVRTGAIRYQYLDITESSSIPKAYVLPADQKQKYEADEEACIAAQK